MPAHPHEPGPPTSQRQPILNLPEMVTTLIVVTVLIHVGLSLLPASWQAQVIWSFGFVPARYTIAETLSWPALVGPISHQFLHGGLLHLVLNMVVLAAFGSGVERVIGAKRMLVFYLTCGVIGAFTHLAAYPGLPEAMRPVVGASGAISGLFGGVLRLMARQARSGGRSLRLVPLVVLWVGLLIFGGFADIAGAERGAVAWAAHVGGFVAGVAIYGWFDRGRRPPLGP